MVKNDDIGEKVIGILEKSIDSKKGFKAAYESVKDENLKKYFLEKTAQREEFIHELKMQVSKINKTEFNASGSFGAGIHRAWMDIKSFLSHDSDTAILEESIKGEKVCLNEFEQTLDSKYLPLEIRDIISKQYNIIKSDLETIKSLEDIKKHFS